MGDISAHPVGSRVNRQYACEKSEEVDTETKPTSAMHTSLTGFFPGNRFCYISSVET